MGLSKRRVLLLLCDKAEINYFWRVIYPGRPFYFPGMANVFLLLKEIRVKSDLSSIRFYMVTFIGLMQAPYVSSL